MTNNYIVAFTGHRPQKLKCSFSDLRQVIEDFLVVQIAVHKQVGVISGGALGVDQVAAEVALDLGLPVWFILPFPVNIMSAKWRAVDKSHLRALMARARKTYFISKEFEFSAYQRRNVAMVEHATEVCSVWDGSSGGTSNCVGYANKVGKEVHALFGRLPDA